MKKLHDLENGKSFGIFCNNIFFILYCSLFSARELALNGMQVELVFICLYLYLSKIQSKYGLRVSVHESKTRFGTPLSPNSKQLTSRVLSQTYF